MSLRLLIAILLAATPAFANTNALTPAQIEGRKIVRQILATPPEANFTNFGFLSIRSPKNSNVKIPVQFSVFLTPNRSVSIYRTAPANGAAPSTRLTVTRGATTNRYDLATLPENDHCCPTNTTLTGSQIMQPFAGSDFWPADLGLEFLLWPNQQLLKKELRRNQSCYVIESLNPDTNGYSRVVSWMDIDTVRDTGQPAIIHADVYDAHGKLLKIFEPKELKKVNGVYQLQEMEMRNVQTGSRTRIEFQFDEP